MRRRFIKTTSSKLSKFDINNYITIEALEDNLTIKAGVLGRAYYGIDGIGWNEYETLTEIVLNRGQTISFKGTNTKAQFYIDKFCNILGNGYSLLVGDEAINTTDIFVFGNDILSFSKCPIINVASNFLPATTIAGGCYDSMFKNCTNLTVAPTLPATTLAYECYNYMFYGCTSLTTAPELPTTTLANNCYSHMFYGCTSLTTAPELPATTLVRYCYECMFYNCKKLSYIKMLAKDISATSCLEDWVFGVASTGTFIKNPRASWDVVGNNGVPNGWTVKFDGEEESESLQFPLTLMEGDNGELGKQFYQYVVDGKYTNEEVHFIRNGYVYEISNWYWASAAGYVGSWDWNIIDATHGEGSPSFDEVIIHSDGFLECV